MSTVPSPVLIVDDEPHIRLALQVLLEQEGYPVVVAADGEQALIAAEHRRPALILLDVMMPGLDGFAVARMLRQQADFADTAIVFLTAKGTRDDRRQGYASGAEVYISKPFDNDDLLDVVRELFPLKH